MTSDAFRNTRDLLESVGLVNREAFLSVTAEEHRKSNRQLHSAAAMWIASGRVVIRPTASLVVTLLLTDTGSCDQVPFDGFLIELPRGVRFEFNTGNVESAVAISVTRADKGFRVVTVTDNMRTFGVQDVTSLDHLPGEHGLLLRGLCQFMDAKIEKLEADNRTTLLKSTGEPRAAVYTVGRSVKISNELRDLARRADGPPLWRLKHGRVVRGHWKNQPHGPQQVLRKKIRVAPYWRGPDTKDALVTHFYDLA